MYQSEFVTSTIFQIVNAFGNGDFDLTNPSSPQDVCRILTQDIACFTIKFHLEQKEHRTRHGHGFDFRQDPKYFCSFPSD